MMAENNEWLIEFYITPDGTSPIEVFLDTLDLKTRARFRWSMEQLRQRNVQAHEPLVKHLEGKLWELREESQTNIYRVIYFFFTGRRIILVHGFGKKKQKTPAKELEIARKRYFEFLQREGKEEE